MYRFKLTAHGRYGLFTTPESGPDRISYPCLTPSAAVGILESLFYKPEMEWRVHSITIHNPIKWINLMRNELDHSLSGKLRTEPVDITAQPHTQRRSRLLFDLCYTVEASVELTASGVDCGYDTTRYYRQAERRLKYGREYKLPCFGCMEFPAYLEPALDLPVLPLNMNLGRMFFGWYREPRGVLPKRVHGVTRHLPNRRTEFPMFFDAVVKNGRLDVPDYQTVVQANRGAA